MANLVDIQIKTSMVKSWANIVTGNDSKNIKFYYIDMKKHLLTGLGFKNSDHFTKRFLNCIAAKYYVTNVETNVELQCTA